MGTYVSTITKIYWKTEEEFIRKFNQLGVVADMEFKISRGVPDHTCTSNCSEVFYYRLVV